MNPHAPNRKRSSKPQSQVFLPRLLLAGAAALVGFGCQATAPDIQPRSDDFAQIQFRAANTDITNGPNNLALHRRLVREFDGLVKLSPNGDAAVVRVPEKRDFDWSALDTLFQYAGYRLDSVALFTVVEVVDGELRIPATGQVLPPAPTDKFAKPGAAARPAQLPAAQRWVEVRGTGPAWPLSAVLLASSPTVDMDDLVPGGR